jgi:hypothetical protein
MPGKRTWIAAALAGLLAATGCCSWCQHHCPCAAPAPAPGPAVVAPASPSGGCCVPCQPTTCCPVNSAPLTPVPAPPQPAYSPPSSLPPR